MKTYTHQTLEEIDQKLQDISADLLKTTHKSRNVQLRKKANRLGKWKIRKLKARMDAEIFAKNPKPSVFGNGKRVFKI